MANLMDLAKRDAEAITQNDGAGFAKEIRVIHPSGTPSITVKGIATIHHINIDETDGNIISGRNAQCTIAEKALTDQEYPVRNNENDVNMGEHIIEFEDSNELSRSFRIKEQFPDERLGLIVFTLGVNNNP